MYRRETYGQVRTGLENWKLAVGGKGRNLFRNSTRDTVGECEEYIITIKDGYLIKSGKMGHIPVSVSWKVSYWVILACRNVGRPNYLKPQGCWI